MCIKLAPISPISGLSTSGSETTSQTAQKDIDDSIISISTHSTTQVEEEGDFSLKIVERHDENDESLSTVDDSMEIPSKLSSLPVALVVEQTARILEDIKKKIQLQREEEERLRNEEQQNESQKLIEESPTVVKTSTSTFSTLPKQARESSEERTFSASSTKSFVILNNSRFGDASNTSATQKIPTTTTAIPTRSLSPDSGTEFSLPFSASSSISPPFLSEKKGNTNSLDYPSKLFSHNNVSDDEIFKSLTTYSSSYASSSVIYSTPKYTAVSPTSPLSSKRRFSGITIPFTTTTSLAKSTPSISTDLINEGHEKSSSKYILTTSGDDIHHQIHHHHHHHHHNHHQQKQQHVRPLSFQVLESDFTFETYHQTSQLDATTKTRFKSLANLPTSSSTIATSTVAALRPSIAASSTVATAAATSNLSRASNNLVGSLLNGNVRQAFGDDPWHIKPISSALEFSNNSAFKMPSFPISSIDTLNSMRNNVEKTASFEKSSAKSFDESLIIPRIDHLSRKIEKIMRPENSSSQRQQSTTDYLSLSLSPPLNRRNKNMLMLKGIGLSL